MESNCFHFEFRCIINKFLTFFIWPNEYRSLEEAKASLDRYICFYNYERVHSALGRLLTKEGQQPFSVELEWKTFRRKVSYVQNQRIQRISTRNGQHRGPCPSRSFAKKNQ
ncbi:transposase [Thermoactinomyces sp. CICC 10521]|nr:transposase [Thermoactinomyces sp. CICC 10521]